MQVNKDMLIGELLQIDINIAQLLMGAGMHCVGCPSSQGETLEEACMVHGISVDKLVAVIKAGRPYPISGRSAGFSVTVCKAPGGRLFLQ